MGKPEQDMLSAPVVDLEQRDKNNKKATRNSFGGPGGPPANSIFNCQPAYKQVVKLPAGKLPGRN